MNRRVYDKHYQQKMSAAIKQIGLDLIAFDNSSFIVVYKAWAAGQRVEENTDDNKKNYSNLLFLFR